MNSPFSFICMSARSVLLGSIISFMSVLYALVLQCMVGVLSIVLSFL